MRGVGGEGGWGEDDVWQEQSASFSLMCFGTDVLVNANFVMPMVQEFP